METYDYDHDDFYFLDPTLYESAGQLYGATNIKPPAKNEWPKGKVPVFAY